MNSDAPPKVLASVTAEIANGRAVRLTGQCVPDTDGALLLALRLDGRETVRARDDKPVSAQRKGVEGTPAVFAYARPDSEGPANLIWDDFVVKTATVNATDG